MNYSKYLTTAFIFVISILLIGLFAYLFDQQSTTNKRIDNLYGSLNKQTKELANLNNNIKSHNEKSHEIIGNINSTKEPENPVKKTCVLSGGEIVNDGWAGKDTSDNYCNQCRCMNGALACTKMACLSKKSDNLYDDTIKIDLQKTDMNNSLSKEKKQIDVIIDTNTKDNKSDLPDKNNDCGQADHFIDVKANNANNLYPVPELEVSCESDNLIIKSNGIPIFEFKTKTPNPLLEQSHNWSIPKNPKLADTITDLPLLGTVAIAIDGLPYYGPNEGPPQGFGDPFLDEILDYCNGHTAPGGDYHYHSVPSCLITDNESKIIGYSLDGFEIVSPNKNIKSSWKKTSTARSAWEANEFIEGYGDLDRCNGKIDDDGVYRYHATNSFPYIIGCYKGVIENVSNNNTSDINNTPRQRPSRSQINPPLRQMPKRND